MDGATPLVVICDVSLLFQGQIFQLLIPRKYVKYDFIVAIVLELRPGVLTAKICENLIFFDVYNRLFFGYILIWEWMPGVTRRFSYMRVDELYRSFTNI